MVFDGIWYFASCLTVHRQAWNRLPKELSIKAMTIHFNFNIIVFCLNLYTQIAHNRLQKNTPILFDLKMLAYRDLMVVFYGMLSYISNEATFSLHSQYETFIIRNNKRWCFDACFWKWLKVIETRINIYAQAFVIRVTFKLTRCHLIILVRVSIFLYIQINSLDL